MNPLIVILGLIVIGVIAFGLFVLAPLTNKLFAYIWSEDETPVVQKETKERLDELFVDSDVPEETAVLMTAVEQNIDEKKVLEMFGAMNAKDLKNIMASKNSGVMRVLGILDKASKKNMKRS